ncbi:MAG: glutamine-hydrolyzing carbamoyl-phosphate synthase small subunit [Thermomicrobiales bacterium]|nr:glutamine-hydrolyzing carbamoyl-phosphate synthase small subunit [Thermomicrobiales bacterium]MCO5226602.1 glutamine-hydrolyzing carbamoyl-phosphate synthase small subunit [Thermomicrobiales bacterium]
MPSKQYQPAWNAVLALADGTIFRGIGFGADTDGAGEVVFTTSMTGYQEVCTDPSFRGQIVCMTYPLIGNYGVNNDDDQSRQPWIAGLVVRENADYPSNWRSVGTIHDYLKDAGVPGISNIDTRALTRHIRSVGDLRAVLIHNANELSDDEIIARAKAAPLPGEHNVVTEVQGMEEVTFGDDNNGPTVVVLDCGVKQNIIDSLTGRGAKVRVLPYGTPYSRIQEINPDGVIVSPGPGDPANLDDGLDVVRHLIEDRRPYFGICLGHQLLARAIGAETNKLKFGHRGGNQPVIDHRNGRVTMTAQNHSFQVASDSVPEADGWRVALQNLNDGSVEGLTHDEIPVLSVQFHPEAAPGPADNGVLFDEFVALISNKASEGVGAGA